MDFLSDHVSAIVEKAMDGHLLRQKAIASNVANAETPGYKRRDVAFEGLLQQAVEQASQSNGPLSPGSHPTGAPLGQSLQQVLPTIEELEATDYRQDKNSVDLEYEMAMLSKNAGRYSALAKMESKLLRGLRGVIGGGGA